MKGIVFTELLDLVESEHGYEMVDTVIQKCQLPNDGAYSRVGTYDHNQLIHIVGEFSTQLNVPAPELVKTFGRHLFEKFTQDYHPLISKFETAFDLLSHVDDIIHVEVRKLWPKAELPQFDCRLIAEKRLEMKYKSNRPFADLAEGLIASCIEYFGDPVTLTRHDEKDDGTQATFILSHD